MALGSTEPLTGAFPGGKGGRCVRLTTLPPSCAIVMKSGNLNFLETFGPLQASNGTASPIYIYIYICILIYIFIKYMFIKYAYTQVRTLGQVLTNCVALQWVEFGSP